MPTPQTLKKRIQKADNDASVFHAIVASARKAEWKAIDAAAAATATARKVIEPATAKIEAIEARRAELVNDLRAVAPHLCPAPDGQTLEDKLPPEMLAIILTLVCRLERCRHPCFGSTSSMDHGGLGTTDEPAQNHAVFSLPAVCVR